MAHVLYINEGRNDAYYDGVRFYSERFLHLHPSFPYSLILMTVSGGIRS